MDQGVHHFQGVFKELRLRYLLKLGGVCHGANALFQHRCMVPMRRMRMEVLVR